MGLEQEQQLLRLTAALVVLVEVADMEVLVALGIHHQQVRRKEITAAVPLLKLLMGGVAVAEAVLTH